jgi:hypothetical protein
VADASSCGTEERQVLRKREIAWNGAINDVIGLSKLTACRESSGAANFVLRAKVSNLLARVYRKSIAGFCSLSRHTSSSPPRVSAQPFIFQNLYIPEDPRACDTRFHCEDRLLSCELNSSNELHRGEGSQSQMRFSPFIISCSKELRPVSHTNHPLQITMWKGIWDRLAELPSASNLGC